jgi:hypothetical protein
MGRRPVPDSAHVPGVVGARPLLPRSSVPSAGRPQWWRVRPRAGCVGTHRPDRTPLGGGSPLRTLGTTHPASPVRADRQVHHGSVLPPRHALTLPAAPSWSGNRAPSRTSVRYWRLNEGRGLSNRLPSTLRRSPHVTQDVGQSPPGTRGHP